MSRFKEIFSNRPESMSNIVKWFFGLPMAYVLYLVLSLILPNSQASANAVIISQMLRSLILALSVILICKYFLKMRISKILSESGKLSFKLGFAGFSTMLLALVVTNICLYFIFPGSIQKATLAKGFLTNWFCSLALVAVSAFSEELIFRAYIAWFGKTDSENDILNINSKKILVYALVSAAFFTIAHFQNPEVEKSAVYSMLFYFVFGFCLMLYFFKTKGIEYSLGVHFANNVFAAWILNYSNSVLPTQSLFVNTLPISFVTVLQAVICLIFCTIFCPDKKN